ncbi:SH3 domain-containing protein [Leptolyngbya sp. 7M]|uniref:SH3 domain-containing protein n=1 Tax=Leptolyngbya sp. 7M TaxID=2812896 RepID=UPI001B8C95DA|nr:SH3 domain-containing protein [Leptolyngbya sp. 7M]QYO66199.1 SH3 domain-containing protein [Leptolyngbya sp. 7M]
MKIFKVALFVFALAASIYAQERYVTPVDEAIKDASFMAFRTKLIAAAERKDLAYVKSIMDPNIKLSFGGHTGLKGFDQLWKNKADFWDQFPPVIKNGGRFTGEGRNKMNSFTAPYLYTEMPDDLDAFDHHVIFGNNVNLRERPSMQAKVLDQLSYNVVKAKDTVFSASDRSKPEWIRIETLGGKTGYVNARYVRSPIDYRAGFEKKRGVWKMTFFIAGD